MQLRFAKMHGLGNDFMIVDLVTQPATPKAEQIRAWSDRRTGIGFDQFLAVLPPDDQEADFRCRIFNADGGEAEQCGNGARCFARFVVDSGLTVKRELVVQTPGGVIQTCLTTNGEVRVDMGMPSTLPADLPFVASASTPAKVDDEGAVLSYAIDIGGKVVEFTPVSMGNPHAVVFADNVAHADVEGIGVAVQRHECFPEQVNVGFLQVVDRRFARLRVYERGSGETRACGTGACAAMVAGWLHGHFDDKAKISLPGGKLRLAWRGPGAPVTLSGAADLVYNGRINYETNRRASTRR